tara:strand:+ start:288 stop:692 length:405 start_codon:yes stop_codon:yes gene_type:complete
MTLSDILFQKNTRNHDSNYRHITNNVDDFHALIDFGGYILSIVQNDRSYGGHNGYFEIGCFSKDPDTGYASGMMSLPGVTDEGDSIKGWLTFTQVDTIIRQLEFESLTVHNVKPKQLLVTSENDCHAYRNSEVD